MGTGIVANAGATLPIHLFGPIHFPGLYTFTRVVWVIAALLLVVLLAVIGGHWLRHPTAARSHARNPQMAHFYGAAPMALLTVASGAVLVGGDLIGERAAATVACWTMALPQLVVIALLANWNLQWPAAMVAFSLAMQVVLMQRVLAAPAANAPFYNATGTSLYVLGMLASAFGLSVIV